jgi:hypothetical protein
MDTIINLEPNAPHINDDFTLGVLSFTINEDGVVKTFYFQHVEGGLIVNDELAEILRTSVESARTQDGDNGISTQLSSFIPSEIMDSSLIGIRQVGIDHIDSTKTKIVIEKIAMKTRMPQALLFYMLDTVLSEYNKNPNILRFEIDSNVIAEAKQVGYFHHMNKFIESRELKQEIVDGVEKGYVHEDTMAIRLAELRKYARVTDVEATRFEPIKQLEANNIRPFTHKKEEGVREHEAQKHIHFRPKIR